MPYSECLAMNALFDMCSMFRSTLLIRRVIRSATLSCPLVLIATVSLAETAKSLVVEETPSTNALPTDKAGSTLAFRHASCKPDLNPLKASYLLKANTSNGQSLGPDQVVHVWREGDESRRVAHSFPGSSKMAATSEVWNTINNGLLRVVKHFDDHKRAIEYEPIDIGSPQASSSWVSKYYLIPNALYDKAQREASTIVEQSGDCLVHTTLAATTSLTEFRVTWDTALQLPVYFSMRQLMDNLQSDTPTFGVVEWELTELSEDAAVVADQYQRWDEFDTMDFADIGDNENDPFLMTMINLGFINHGASGFYDSQGGQLSGGHRHYFSVIK